MGRRYVYDENENRILLITDDTQVEIESNVGYTYNRENNRVFQQVDGKNIEIYSNVSDGEFELIREVDICFFESTVLHENLLDYFQTEFFTASKNLLSAKEGVNSARLNRLQENTANCFQLCDETQQLLETKSDTSELLEKHLDILFKIKKFLKHCFRVLSAMQSIVFSHRLLTNYLRMDDEVYLYSFVRSACSTIEYLGVLIENKVGNGTFDLTDRSVNFADVYEELKEQDLIEFNIEDQEIILPPRYHKEPVEELVLNTKSIEYLRNCRNQIVHQCPLIIPESSTEHLSEKIIDTRVFTSKDLEKITYVTSKLHFHSSIILFTFMKGYTHQLSGALVNAIYHET